jgi:hypothetical protein
MFGFGRRSGSGTLGAAGCGLSRLGALRVSSTDRGRVCAAALGAGVRIATECRCSGLGGARRVDARGAGCGLPTQRSESRARTAGACAAAPGLRRTNYDRVSMFGSGRRSGEWTLGHLYESGQSVDLDTTPRKTHARSRPNHPNHPNHASRTNRRERQTSRRPRSARWRGLAPARQPWTSAGSAGYQDALSRPTSPRRPRPRPALPGGPPPRAQLAPRRVQPPRRDQPAPPGGRSSRPPGPPEGSGPGRVSLWRAAPRARSAARQRSSRFRRGSRRRSASGRTRLRGRGSPGTRRPATARRSDRRSRWSA